MRREFREELRLQSHIVKRLDESLCIGGPIARTQGEQGPPGESIVGPQGPLGPKGEKGDVVTIVDEETRERLKILENKVNEPRVFKVSPQELLRMLPQGKGSGLNADMVDGMHTTEIVDLAVQEAPRRPVFSSGSSPASPVIVSRGALSDPPGGAYEVTNLYVEVVEGNPKLRVEYEE